MGISAFLLGAIASQAGAAEIVFVGSASTGASNSNTLTLSLSGTLVGGAASSPAAGDVVIPALVAPGTTDRALRCTGDGSWTDYTELDEAYADDARDTNLSVYAKVMGSTPDTQVQADSYHALGTYGGVLGVTVWRYVNFSTIAFQKAVLSNSSRANPPSVTPDQVGSVVLTVCGTASPPGDVAAPSLSGFDTRLTKMQDSTTCCGKLLMASQVWSGSGAVDPPAITDADADSTNSSAAAFSIVLEPSA